MKTRRERSTAAQMMVGIVVIAMGFIFLLDNLGWIDIDVKIHILPVMLIASGAFSVMQAPSRGRGASAGILMMGFGILLLLKGIGVLAITWNAVVPLLLIGAGLVVVFKAKGHSIAGEAVLDTVEDSTGESKLEMTAILGGFQRKVTSQDFRGGEITSILGGCDVDLRNASITDVATIEVYTLMGGIAIKVPVDWTVELQGMPVLGGFDDKTVVPKDGSKRLVIRGTAIMGGVEIRN